MLLASLLLWAYVVGLIYRHRIIPAAGTPAGATDGRPTAFPHRPAVRVAALFLLAWLLFAFVSTPIGSQLLRASLIEEPEGEAAFAPKYILVASMGYLMTDDPATSVLNDGTALRVAAAARWHQEHPDAFVVMQGSSGSNEPEDHQASLMAHAARSLGVPDDKLLLEPLSRNTREHSENFSRFPQVTSAIPIGIVTSDWHTRRTVAEFRTAFDSVLVRPAEQRQIESLRWTHFIPRESDLHASSRYIREWIAIVYYRLT